MGLLHVFVARRTLNALLGTAVFIFCFEAQVTFAQKGGDNRVSQSEKRQATSLTSWKIIRSLVLNQERIRNLLVEYDLRTRYEGVDTKEPDFYWRRTVAAKKQKRKICVKLIPGQIRPLLDEEFYQSYYDGGNWNVFYPLSRIHQVSKKFVDEAFTYKARGEYFLEALAWWPPDDSSEPLALDGQPFFLKEIFSQEKLDLREALEKAEGIWCYVLDSRTKSQTLFVAANPLVLRKRVIYQPSKKITRIQYVYDQFKEVDKDLWLPYYLERRVFNTINGQLDHTTVFEVVRYQVNNVGDEWFEFKAPPGTLVVDRDLDMIWQIPGGGELIDYTVERVKKISCVVDMPNGKQNTLLLSVLSWLFGVTFAWVFVTKVIRRRVAQ